MPKFSLDDLSAILDDLDDLADTTLGEVKLSPQKAIPEFELGGSKTHSLSGLDLTAGGGGKMQVSLFNDAADEDGDKLLEPTDEDAWLKYSLAAFLKGKASADLGDELTASLSAGQEARTLWYHRRDLGDEVLDSLRGDLSGFRFPHRREDILALEEGDLLAYLAGGTLGLQLSLAWSDALSASIEQLDRLFGVAGAEVFQVEAKLGAKVDFQVGVEDLFRIVFRNHGDENLPLSVALKKTDRSSLGVTGGAGVTLALADRSQVQDLVETYLSQRTGFPIDEVLQLTKEIDDALAFEDLPERWREPAKKLAAELGFGEVQAAWKEVKAQLGITALTGAIEKALKFQAKLQFALEYSRVQTEETLVELRMSKEKLTDGLLRQLLVGDWTEVSKALAAGNSGSGSGFRLVTHLFTETLEKKAKYGFTVGLGSWGAGDTKEVRRRWTRQEDRAQEKKPVLHRAGFDGRWSQTIRWGDREDQVAFELSAGMEEWQDRPPRAGDFSYGIGFGSYWNLATDGAQAEAFDLANLLNLVPESQNGDHASKLSQIISALDPESFDALRFDVDVKIADAGVRQLVRADEDTVRDLWIDAMAAALYTVRSPIFHSVLRSGMTVRQAVYGVAAREVMKPGNAGGISSASVVGRIDYDAARAWIGVPPDSQRRLELLQALDRKDRQRLEQLAGPTTNLPVDSLPALWGFEASTAPNERPHRRLRLLQRLLEELRTAIANQGSSKAVEEAFDDIRKEFKTPFHFRCIAYVLGRLARQLAPPAAYAGSLRLVRITKKGDEETLAVIA